jgi:hypothetical protein
MIQLTKAGVAGNTDVDELADEFEKRHTFLLSQLLGPQLTQEISSRLERCEWTTDDDGKIAREASPTDPAPTHILNFAANTAEFLDVVRRITGVASITRFGGRVYRMVPGADHFDSWHADLGGAHRDRLVGMSINLGGAYNGGLFRLRDETTGEIVREISNTGRGDAIFFRISETLKHMVTAVEGTAPKTAFAGWFHAADKDFYSALRPEAAAPISRNRPSTTRLKKSSNARTLRVSE